MWYYLCRPVSDETADSIERFGVWWARGKWAAAMIFCATTVAVVSALAVAATLLGAQVRT